MEKITSIAVIAMEIFFANCDGKNLAELLRSSYNDDEASDGVY